MGPLLGRLDERSEAALAAGYGPDPVVAATTHYAVAQWFLGDTAGSRASARAALARARDSGNALSRCAALAVCACAYLLARALCEGVDSVERACALSAEEGFPLWNALASALHGWARVQQGRAAEGCDELRRAMASWEATGARFFSTYLCAFLAEGQLRLGAFADGLTTADAGLNLVEKGFDCGYAPELWRLKGELLLAAAAKGHRSPRGGQARGPAARAAAAAWPEAERCLRQALDLARAAAAKSLELRAATSLARAWRAHGRAGEARTVLGEICDWFGVDLVNADLLDARALLGDLVAAH